MTARMTLVSMDCAIAGARDHAAPLGRISPRRCTPLDTALLEQNRNNTGIPGPEPG